MGRFKAKKTIVKKVGGLTIVFWDRESIYCKEGSGTWVVFHKYFAPRGFYNLNWRPFRHLLLYETKIDLWHCMKLARRFGVRMMTAENPPRLEDREIEERIFPG